MNRIDCLIKGLTILRSYGNDHQVTYMDGYLFAGPEDHSRITDSHAKELNDLGWHTTIFGWAFNL
jgi:hypothetical protein